MFAAAGLVVTGAFVVQAQPYYVAGDYNSWQNPSAAAMTQVGDHYDFTITGRTAGAYESLKVTDGTWANFWPGNNLTVRYDATGSATIHFYPGSSSDGWLPLSNRVGYDDPGNLTWGLAGGFDGWDGTQVSLNSIGAGVYSNTIAVATAGTFGFKFQSPPGHWDLIYFGADFGNGGSDGSYTTTNTPQNVPVVLDLPQGRYLMGSLAPQPVTNTVVFAVDMTYQIQLGLFHPGSSVFVAGSFNGWSASGLALTNVPAYNGGSNTNIYYGTNVFVGLPNSQTAQFKFTQNDSGAQNSGWETSNNRTVTLLSTNGTILLPVAVFSDLYGADLLPVDTTVIFTVNMTNAVAYTNGTTYGDPHPFDPASDSVVINGNFLSGGWSAWDPISMSGQILNNNPIGSAVYQFSCLVRAGSPVTLQYKYGMYYSSMTNNLDNEAGFAQNHQRVVRITSTGTYYLPMDTFGKQYAEPDFSQLTTGQPAGGAVPIAWLGRPGVHLQAATNLTAVWQDIMSTDGTNWTTGYQSTNGFVSQTNWPAAGNAFFRLIKP